MINGCSKKGGNGLILILILEWRVECTNLFATGGRGTTHWKVQTSQNHRKGKFCKGKFILLGKKLFLYF